ncbi:MAG TPA: anhydro-N-acetylmuramic acid kinase [Methylococcaceae bacterium]|nr:anhydro-N-acetylmuramic acid kinase [Methylococcaceae bacterium]
MSKQQALYIGLMSGTSLDGIDAVLVDLHDDKIEVMAFEYLPFSSAIQHQLHQLSAPNARVSLQTFGELDTTLGLLFAKTVNALLAKTSIAPSQIKAIGSHGQTVYHAPVGPFPFTLQIGDPNCIAQHTHITTVADFRRRDIAAGGQGAPLVPAFHRAMFASTHETRCVVNIGGIANVTVLPADNEKPVMGFDTGPGNTLINQWIKRHLSCDYDKQGAWAKTGNVNFALVQQLKQDPYFQAPPPKSTGVDYFSLDWLDKHCQLTAYAPQTLQASLTYLTALTICEAIAAIAPDTSRILVCGGGGHNAYLMQLLRENAPCLVHSTAEFGLHPDHVEAVAFAWLAKQTLCGKAGNLQAVTGAQSEVILGGIYYVH